VPTPGIPDFDFKSADFAFLVAAHAWRDGLTANAIVRRLGLPSSPLHLMHVKRALQRGSRFLKLVPPEARELQDKLNDRVNAKRRNPICFHVIEDRWGPTYGPVCARAAQLASEMMLEVVRSSVAGVRVASPSSSVPDDGQSEPDVVICNAGGRTVSEMVRALLRNPPLLDEFEQKPFRIDEHMMFVAGNAAYLPEQFQSSANFLSVTMAELFGAKHLALPKVEDAGFLTRYMGLVDRAALFICGVGTLDTGLMAKYFKDQKWPMPDQAVGDLAFNLLDKDGNAVELSETARKFMNEVNPALNLTKLMHIAARNRVLLILDSEHPIEKSKIAVAALRREYATDVVLGSRLARAILQVY
jgi:hypothetical protein